MSLTDRQQRFVDEYMVDLNATQAALRAGYSDKTARAIGCENLGKPEIADAIAAAQKQRSERTQITQDRVLQELARIGFADMRKLFTWDEDRAAFVPSIELTDDEAAAVAEVQAETTHFTNDDGETTTKIKLKLKTWDKLGALEKIGKHLGMFVERVEHSGEVKGGVLIVPAPISTEDWAKAAEAQQRELSRHRDD